MYILDHRCISPQPTFNGCFFTGEVKINHGNLYYSIEPDYTDLIPKNLLRRMEKATRVGIGAGIPLLEKYPIIDGIILGTSTGGFSGCVEFLKQIVQYNEGTLTPTNFVQSTPNAVAGILALMSKNRGYNITHTNLGLSFEATLLDAMLLLEENEAKQLLVGAIEETSEYNYNIDSASDFFKEIAVPSTQLLQSNTKGSVRGEGAAMFVVSSKKDNALCELVDVAQFSFPQKNTIQEKVRQFLKKTNTPLAAIDALVLGYNGDNRFDFRYDELAEQFNDTSIFSYKNLIGDSPTANSFALWLSCSILEGKEIPKEVYYKETDKEIKSILIYNHYNNIQHSFILMRSV